MFRGLSGVRGILALCLVCLTVSTADAQEGDGVVVENSHEIVFRSDVLGKDIRLLVWLPSQPAPEGGYRVLYALDGGQSFGLLSDAASNVADRAVRTGKPPVMVVGIGYPRGEYDLTKRTYDLTPESPSGTFDMPARPNGKPWPPMGGGDAFLDMIETEVKPLVASRFAADPAHETLYGHSFGGMMTLHALFTRPESFEAYVASSPSLWFNGGQIFDEANAFLVAPAPAGSPRPLYLSVGGAEQTMTAWDNLRGKTEQYAGWKENNRMVDNARDLAALLEEKGADRVLLRFRVVEGEDHMSVRPLIVYHALKVAAE